MRGIEIMQYGARRNDGSAGCEAGLKKTAPVQHGDSQCSAGVCKSSFDEPCSGQATEAVDSLPRLRKACNGGSNRLVMTPPPLPRRPARAKASSTIALRCCTSFRMWPRLLL